MKFLLSCFGLHNWLLVQGQWNQFQPPGIGEHMQILDCCEEMRSAGAASWPSKRLMTALSELLVLCKMKSGRWARYLSPPCSRPCLLLQLSTRRLLLCLHRSAHNYWHILQVSGTVRMLLPLLRKPSSLLISPTGLLSPGESSFRIEYFALC